MRSALTCFNISGANKALEDKHDKLIAILDKLVQTVTKSTEVDTDTADDPYDNSWKFWQVMRGAFALPGWSCG